MKMPGHTPGPWHVGRDTKTNLPVIMAIDGPVIAEVTPWASTTADAHLIAASPELLEACERIYDWWMDRYFDGDTVPFEVHALKEAIETARGTTNA